MKMFKTNLHEIYDEKGNLVGEQVLSSFIKGTLEHLKVNNENFYLKEIGFFRQEVHYYNHDGKLMLKIDAVHQRIFYYGEKYTEIYYYKSTSWYQSSISLYRFEDDQLLVKFRRRYNFSKAFYEAEVVEDFQNKLGISAFIFYHIKGYEDY